MLYGGWNFIQNGALTGQWQWGVDFPDASTAKANGWFPDQPATPPNFNPLTQTLTITRTLQGDVAALSYTVSTLGSADAAMAQRRSLLAQIDALEAQQTPRRLRDAIAGTDNSWLKNLESQIAALRAQMPAVPS